jgi:hypothetical protein
MISSFFPRARTLPLVLARSVARTHAGDAPYPMFLIYVFCHSDESVSYLYFPMMMSDLPFRVEEEAEGKSSLVVETCPSEHWL